MADEHDGAPPQEDINDKLLLDLAWEKQQKKVRRRRGRFCKSCLRCTFSEWRQVAMVGQLVYRVALDC